MGIDCYEKNYISLTIMNIKEHDTQMFFSIEDELLSVIDAYQFELDECPDLDENDRRNLISGINFKYKQIDWLHEIQKKIEKMSKESKINNYE